MFQVKELPRGPTPDELKLVREIYEATGILTVKDRVTGKWVKPKDRCGGVAWETPYQSMPPYGQPYQNIRAGEGGGDFTRETSFVRVTFVEFIGSACCPKGIPFGGVEVWVQDNFTGDTNTFSCTAFRPDVAPGEWDRLACYAKGTTYVDSEMWDRLEKENAVRRDNRAATQMDPAGSLVKSLTEALKQMNDRGPPPELLEKAGFAKNLAGEWEFRGAPALAVPK